MLNFLPCTPGQKFPSLKSWSSTTPYYGEVGDERLLVCGDTSNGIECLDFDDGGSAFKEYWSVIEDSIKEKCYVERTPSGGYHIIYRTPYAKGNKQLAWNSQGALIIETRGQGGLVKVAPSPNYTQISTRNLDDALPTLEQKEVDRLWSVALFLNCKKEVVKPVQEAYKPKKMEGDSPADYLRNEGKALVRNALIRAGWTEIKEDDKNVYFSHPNASNPRDVHLALHKDNGSVHNWSTNKCAPFDGDGDYSPLDVIALLEYNGDTSACGLDIRRKYMDITSAFHVEEEEVDDEDLEVFQRPTLDVKIDELPVILQDFVKAATTSAKIKQTTLSIFSGLCAASYVIARRLRKESADGDVEPYILPLYVMAVSESGTGKDAPLKAGRKLAELGSFSDFAVQPMPMSHQAMGESVIEFKKMYYACDEAGDAIFFDKSNTQVQIKRVMKELFSEKDYKMSAGIQSQSRLKEKLGTEHGIAENQATVFYATGCPDVITNQMSEQDFSEGLAGRFVYCLGDLKAKRIFSLRGKSSIKFTPAVYDWCKMWKQVAVPEFGMSFDQRIAMATINEEGESEDISFKEPETVDIDKTALIVIDDETEVLHNEMANYYYEYGRKCRADSKGLYLRAGLAIETIGVTLACLDSRRIDAIHLEPKHIKLAERIVGYSIKCVEYLLHKKLGTDHATALTKESNDNYKKLVNKLLSHRKDVVSASTIALWFRGNDERVYKSHLGVLVSQGFLEVKGTTKGTSYVINKKKLEKLDI